MDKLNFSDLRHLEAAEGWLGLGDWSEADAELSHIRPRYSAHPEVLRLRYGVQACAGNWPVAAELAHAICQLEPGFVFGWLHQAHALHKNQRTQEALKVLQEAAGIFPCEHLIPYKIACYACQMGDLRAALVSLAKALILAKKKKDLKEMAREDPELEPLWMEIVSPCC